MVRHNASKFLALVLGLFLLAGAQPSANAELSKRDIKERVEEYVDKDTTSERRTEILEEMRAGARLSLAESYLKSALKDEDERPYALDLATALRVKGLFKSIKKEIDGDDEDRIVKYLFVTQDSGAADFLFERWVEKESDSASFELVKEGFAKNYVDLDTIGEFRDYLKDDEADETKAEIARKILFLQMDKPADSQADPEEAWKDFYVDYKTNSVNFAMAGRDVLDMPGWKFAGRIRKFGDNYKLFPAAAMEFISIPDEWQKADFKLKLGVRVTKGEGCQIAFITDAGMFAPEVEGSDWVLKVGGGGRKTCKFEEGKWVTIEFDINYRHEDSIEYRRDCIVKIDDKELLDNGALTGKLERILFLANENAEMTVGGIEYAKKRNNK